MNLLIESSGFSLTHVPSIHDSYLSTRVRFALGSDTRSSSTESSNIRSDSNRSVSSSFNTSLARYREYILFVLSYTGFSTNRTGVLISSDPIKSLSFSPSYPTTIVIFETCCFSICPRSLSIRVTPLTVIIHFVLFLVSALRRLPIPAASIIACINHLTNCCTLPHRLFCGSCHEEPSRYLSHRNYPLLQQSCSVYCHTI